MKLLNKHKVTFIILVIIHFVLVALMLSGTLRNLFYDSSSLRKGQAADFFAVYQAGDNILSGKSLYLDTEGVSTPYSYPFRYLPFIGYTLGVFFNIFEPFTAYYLWIAILEIVLFVNVWMTIRLVNSRGSEPAIWLIASAVWLLFTPYLLELFLGQWSFFMASIIFWTMYGLITKSKFIYSFILAPLVKPNALIAAPLLFVKKKWKVLILTCFGIFITSAAYFIFFRDDISIFMQNFSNNMYSYGGNFGFKSLFYIIWSRYFGLSYARGVFLIFMLILGILSLYLTLKAKREAIGDKRIALLFTIWLCYFFLIYTDIWEHHYTLMMPVFALIVVRFKIKVVSLLKRKLLPVLISFLLISLPSSFILQYLFVANAPVEIDTLNPFFVILYHLQKPLGVGILYVWSAMQIQNSKIKSQD